MPSLLRRIAASGYTSGGTSISDSSDLEFEYPLLQTPWAEGCASRIYRSERLDVVPGGDLRQG